MTAALPRSAWSDTPPASPGVLDPAEVAGLAVHYMGPKVPASVYAGDLDATARFLEAIRRYHVLPGVLSPAGGSDIAYQQLVDVAGRRWTGRGWALRSAANGGTWPNRRYGAVAFLIGEGQTPSPEMLAAGAEAVAEFRGVYPHARTVKTHAQVRPEPTACPGPHLTRWVRLNRYEETDDMTTDEMLTALRDALKDDAHPLTKQLRRNIREAVQDELVQERRGENPPT